MVRGSIMIKPLTDIFPAEMRSDGFTVFSLSSGVYSGNSEVVSFTFHAAYRELSVGHQLLIHYLPLVSLNSPVYLKQGEGKIVVS